MYITIKGIVGGKSIKLPRPISNLIGTMRAAIVEVLLDCAVYENRDSKYSRGKVLESGRHMSKELKERGFTTFEMKRIDGLRGITELKFDLKELHSEDNIVDGRPDNELMTYHVSDSSHKIDVIRFEPKRLRYKNLKVGKLDSLTLRVVDQNNNIVKEGLTATVILHIE